MFGPVEIGARSCRIRPRHFNRLPFSGREVITEIADTVVNDPAQPAREGPLVGVFESLERLMRGKVSFLQHIAAFEFVAQFRTEPCPNEEQCPVGVQPEQTIVGGPIAGTGLFTKCLREGVHTPLSAEKPASCPALSPNSSNTKSARARRKEFPPRLGSFRTVRQYTALRDDDFRCVPWDARQTTEFNERSPRSSSHGPACVGRLTCRQTVLRIVR